MINSVLLQVNSKCNLKCEHCFYDKSEENLLDLSYDKSVAIINKLYKEGVKNISFIFKEPLLNKDLFKMIKYCEKKDISTGILTNGITLEKNINNILDTNLVFLGISLDGIDSKSNDKIRGNGSFECVVKGIKAFIEKRNILKKYIPIVIYMTIGTLTEEEQKKIPQVFTRLGVDKVIVKRIDTSIGKAKKNINIFKNRECDFELIAQSYSMMSDTNLILEFFTTPLESLYYNFKYQLNLVHTTPYCGILANMYHVNSNGDFNLCFVDDIRKNNDEVINLFTDIEMLYEKRNKFLSDYQRSKEIYQDCKRCFFKKECNPCFLNMDVYKDFRDRCEKYINYIEKFIEEIQNSEKRYVLCAKKTSYIEIGAKDIQIVNLIQEGIEDRISLNGRSPKEKKILRDVYEKKVPIFLEKGLAFKEFLVFLVMTNCFYVKEEKNE